VAAVVAANGLEAAVVAELAAIDHLLGLNHLVVELLLWINLNQ
jgi:hypothetical protein